MSAVSLQGGGTEQWGDKVATSQSRLSERLSLGWHPYTEHRLPNVFLGQQVTDICSTTKPSRGRS